MKIRMTTAIGTGFFALLYMAAIAPAAVIGLTNGDFENGASPDDTEVNDFFESSDTGYADYTAEGSLSTRLSLANAFNSTDALAIGSDGYVYQQIGTYTANETVTLTGSAYRVRVHDHVLDFTVKLYVGDVTGATGSTLSTLGATELDSATITSADLGFTGTSPGLSMGPGALDIDLLSGNSGTDGQKLWLEIAYSAGSGVETYFDDLAVSGVSGVSVGTVPEPSTLILAALGFVVLMGTRRRRRK